MARGQDTGRHPNRQVSRDSVSRGFGASQEPDNNENNEESKPREWPIPPIHKARGGA